jgi:hypothetical protein
MFQNEHLAHFFSLSFGGFPFFYYLCNIDKRKT